MPPRITAKDIGTSAVTFTKRNFNAPTGKARECRVHFAFTSANKAYSMPHGLRRVPQSFTVVACGGADAAGGATLTAPGIVYSASALPGQALNATKNVIVLACSVALSWAEVVIR